MNDALLTAASSLITTSEEVAVNQRDIVFSPAAHESSLLRPPTSYLAEDGTTVIERPCVFGVCCLGREPSILDSHIQGGGHTLREYVTPEEEMLLRTHGVEPATRRFCIICERWKTDRLLHGDPILKNISREQALQNKPSIINFFTNTHGLGEYRKDVLIDGESRDGSCIVGKVVRPSLHLLRWRTDDMGRPFLDQSALLHDNNLEEKKDFGGAAVTTPSIE